MITMVRIQYDSKFTNMEGSLEFSLGIKTVGHARGGESPSRYPLRRLDQFRDDIVNFAISKRIGVPNFKASGLELSACRDVGIS